MNKTYSHKKSASYLTQKDKLRSLREDCRSLGLVFKIDNSIMLNNQTAYKIVDRLNDTVLSSNHTIKSAFDSQENTGFIYTLANDRQDIDEYLPRI